MKISDCWAFSPFKTLPGCRAFRHSDKNIGIQVRQFPIHPILPSMPFLIFWSGSFAVQFGDHFRSGIISGPIGRSFTVRDHLRSWDHLRTRTDPEYCGHKKPKRALPFEFRPKISIRVHDGSWQENFNLLHVRSCEMLTFCDVTDETKQNRKLSDCFYGLLDPRSVAFLFSEYSVAFFHLHQSCNIKDRFCSR